MAIIIPVIGILFDKGEKNHGAQIKNRNNKTLLNSTYWSLLQKDANGKAESRLSRRMDELWGWSCSPRSSDGWTQKMNWYLEIVTFDIRFWAENWIYYSEWDCWSLNKSNNASFCSSCPFLYCQFGEKAASQSVWGTRENAHYKGGLVYGWIWVLRTNRKLEDNELVGLGESKEVENKWVKNQEMRDYRLTATVRFVEICIGCASC